MTDTYLENPGTTFALGKHYVTCHIKSEECTGPTKGQRTPFEAYMAAITDHFTRQFLGDRQYIWVCQGCHRLAERLRT